MRLLHLEKCADTKIGNPFMRGVSGGIDWFVFGEQKINIKQTKTEQTNKQINK